MFCSGWRIAPDLDLSLQCWPHGGVVFCRASGDTHWVPEAACVVLQILQPAPLSLTGLRQRLARLLEMAEDDPDLCRMVDEACEALAKVALIDPTVC